LLFPLFALGLSLGLVELGLRVGGIAYPALDRPTYGLREWGVPHAEGWATGETRQWVRLNAEGARDRDHAVAKPPDTLRIVVVGDSYTSAFHVPLEATFWSVAERRLADCDARRGREIELIALGKEGYGTVEELLALRRFGFRYAPDWVVLAFLTGNDFRNNSPALKRSDRPYFVLEEGGLRLDESYAERASFRRWAGWEGDLWYGLVNRVRIVQVARHVASQVERRLEAAKDETRAKQAAPGAEPGLDDGIYLEPDDAAWRSAWQTTEAVIERMRDEVREHDARFLLMTLSNAIQVNPDAALRTAYAERTGAVDLFAPDRRLARFAEAAGIPVLTLAPTLRAWAEQNDTCVHGFEAPWICQGHWNVHGHRVAGEALATRLCEELGREAAGR